MTNEHLPGYGPPALPPGTSRPDMWRRVLILLLLVCLGIGVYQFFGSSFRGAPDRPGWTMFESRRNGWSVQFPDSWHARRISHTHHGRPYTQQVHSLVISNVDRGLKRADCGRNCFSPWVGTVGLPSNGIAVQIGWNYSGGFGVRCEFPSTALPLSLSHATRTLSRDGAGGTPQLEVSMGFAAGGSPRYHVMAWIGSKASKTDLDALEKIVSSISYDEVTFKQDPSGKAFSVC